MPSLAGSDNIFFSLSENRRIYSKLGCLETDSLSLFTHTVQGNKGKSYRPASPFPLREKLKNTDAFVKISLGTSPWFQKTQLSPRHYYQLLENRGSCLPMFLSSEPHTLIRTYYINNFYMHETYVNSPKFLGFLFLPPPLSSSLVLPCSTPSGTHLSSLP